MSILTGRLGTVKFDPAAASPLALVAIASLNTWALSLKTDYTEVTCFADTNKVYVPGLRDVSGSIGGFWNSAELTLITAVQASTAGYLELAPNSGEPTFTFGGLAYLDANIDCGLTAPKISGSFRAGGAWTLPA